MKKKFSLMALVAALLLSLSVLPASAALPDYYEPNNTFDTAYALAPNTSIATILSNDNDRDYYKFQVGSVGPGKFFDVHLVSPSGFPYSLIITKNGGTSVTKYQLDGGGVTGFSSYRVPIEANTTYYFLVSQIGGPTTQDANYFLLLGNVY
ncbi:hypothetical protein [Cohnella phaseoli]|uniref:hypothetical protein n=1 Tax=Cohnella phaseoli TaxID=456490 RepID=UPI000E25EBC9|nr:hypothetical protein [Cohnella phaseoli]